MDFSLCIDFTDNLYSNALYITKSILVNLKSLLLQVVFIAEHMAKQSVVKLSDLLLLHRTENRSGIGIQFMQSDTA